MRLGWNVSSFFHINLMKAECSTCLQSRLKYLQYIQNVPNDRVWTQSWPQCIIDALVDGRHVCINGLLALIYPRLFSNMILNILSSILYDSHVTQACKIFVEQHAKAFFYNICLHYKTKLIVDLTHFLCSHNKVNYKFIKQFGFTQHPKPN